MSHSDILIVGSGHAGAQAAIALRMGGFAGSISIVTEEQAFPYERPALSKEYLAGDRAFDQMHLKPETYWNDRKVSFLFSRRVVAVDPAAHHVVDDAGQALHYGKLIWAAGGHARRLNCEGSDLQGIHTIRTHLDVDALAAALPGGDNVTVIGAGYIGLEAAAVLVKLAKKVVVLEAMDRVLARVAGAPISDFYAREHRAHGVDLRLGAVVDRLIGAAGRVTAVSLADGRIIPTDIVIVGIGIVPSVEPLLAAGAIGTNGVEVDEFGRTSLADIYAIGDCAAHVNAFGAGRRLRLESVQNATDQASVAANDIMGKSEPYHAVPWFWSHQYDLRLQTVGLSIGYDQTVLRGDPATRSFTLAYLMRGRVIAFDCVNAVKDYVQGKALVQNGSMPDLKDLADTTKPLKALV
jgi:3-phenylpropionate/trans-cinnamate dioxygenase ferredoxin reductase subunit